MDEKTAQLHLREAKIIVEKYFKNNGIILIDDVKSIYVIKKLQIINTVNLNMLYHIF